jgi:MATE family multidrug resistance protein
MTVTPLSGHESPLLAASEKGWRHELRATLSLAWPLVLTNVTMSMIGATDVLMIGWLGGKDLAAATIGFNLCMMVALFCMGLVTASAPMMASEIGRKANSVRDIRRTFRQTCWMAGSVMLPIWLILWNGEAILLLLGQTPVLAAKAEGYIRSYMFSILPFLLLIAARNFLSALERPIWSLIVGVAGVLVNIAINYTLIFGNFGFPAFGIIGAGIASILSNMMMFIAMVIVISKDRQFRRYRLFGNFWRADWPRFRQLWALGLPIAVTLGLEGGVFSIAALLMGWIDTLAVAAHAIALQIASLSFMVPMGIAQATTVRVGIGHGRKDPAHISRAGWTGFTVGTGFMVVMALFILLFPAQLAGLFLDQGKPDTPAVLALAVEFLFIAAIFQIVDGAQVIGAGMLRGLHDTRIPMFIAAFGYWGIGIGVGAWLAFGAGWRGAGLWTGLASGLAAVAVLMVIRWMMRERLNLVSRAL